MPIKLLSEPSLKSLPFPFMTDSSRGWNESIFNHDRYDELRRICHSRCVICGGADWLLFERLDTIPQEMIDADSMFKFWFGGLSARKTVAVCLDCSLQARIGWWDRRLSDRFAVREPISNIIQHQIPYYYGLCKSLITPPARATSDEKRKKPLSGGGRRTLHKEHLRKLLGGKCSLCPQDTNIHLDCIKPQYVRHTSVDNWTHTVSFYLWQLSQKNLRLICTDCDRARTSFQNRASGHYRRLLFGRKLIAWFENNKSAATCLEQRMSGVKPARVVREERSQLINGSVHSCGHIKLFHWLLVDDNEHKLWFCCEGCWRTAPDHFRKIALLMELERKRSFAPKFDELVQAVSSEWWKN
jgi:hypothetical protein